jgi:hypothetical protein
MMWPILRSSTISRLNRILPQRIKRLGIELIRESTKDTEGFPPYYDKCSPREFADMARGRGLQVVDERHYYLSSYFFSFVPFYVLWRLWTLLYYLMDTTRCREFFDDSSQARLCYGLTVSCDRER